MGVLGQLRAHYGVVEAQGHGSLHLHMLLWLKNAPSSESMQLLLCTEEFQKRVAEYVDANVRAHLDRMTEDMIIAMEHETDLTWSRPPNPNSPDFKKDFAIRERRLVRSQQVHTCRKFTCLVYRPQLCEWVCKRRAPFATLSQTMVKANGMILPRRTYGYLNNWNPLVNGHAGLPFTDVPTRQ
jgi:hypothetical protein